MPDIRVLVADDDPTIRNLLRTVCEMAGYDVSTARHGAEALDILLRADAPWIVLLDIEMPFLTGPEVCARLVTAGGIAASHRVLLITAGTFPQDDPPPPAWAVLYKPLDIDDLLVILARFAAGTQTRSDGQDATSDSLYEHEVA